MRVHDIQSGKCRASYLRNTEEKLWDMYRLTERRMEGRLPYIYIDKIFHELRSELLSAMHTAVERETRNGRVDVDRLFRTFTRTAAGKCANPQRVSDKCVTETTTSRA